jgi:hypothetical protein
MMSILEMVLIPVCLILTGMVFSLAKLVRQKDLEKHDLVGEATESITGLSEVIDVWQVEFFKLLNKVRTPYSMSVKCDSCGAEKSIDVLYPLTAEEIRAGANYERRVREAAGGDQGDSQQATEESGGLEGTG